MDHVASDDRDDFVSSEDIPHNLSRCVGGPGRLFPGIQFDEPVRLTPLSTSLAKGNDRCDMDLENREMFVVEQTDEDGNVHSLHLSPLMVIELVSHLRSWISIGGHI